VCRDDPAASIRANREQIMSILTIAENFHVTGQITPTEMKNIASLGYKTVICMRPDKEASNQPAFADMAAAARAEGIQAVYIPVVPGAITAEQVSELKKIVDASQGPLLAYCASGNRCAAAYDMAKRI
jgi:sulfide:quinone oxidoreductase